MSQHAVVTLITCCKTTCDTAHQSLHSFDTPCDTHQDHVASLEKLNHVARFCLKICQHNNLIKETALKYFGTIFTNMLLSNLGISNGSGWTGWPDQVRPAARFGPGL